MNRRRIVFPSLLLVLPLVAWWAIRNLPATTDPLVAARDPDFLLQGEYTGKMGAQEIGIQIVARGRGRFEAVICRGGLPGQGWDGEEPRPRLRFRKRRNAEPEFRQGDWIGKWMPGEIRVTCAAPPGPGAVLKKVERESSTLGVAPPVGARILFDQSEETAARHWKKPRLDGPCLREGQTTRESYGGCRVHLEFRLPWKPGARGQNRGNSGLFLADRYEVQILDSFGREAKADECGAIYGFAAPSKNMSYPPLRWQTYDIEFTAPRFDEAGRKTANARIHVRHNGVTIHEDLEILRPTGLDRFRKEAARGPIFLQNHGNPIHFRNIWILER